MRLLLFIGSVVVVSICGCAATPHGYIILRDVPDHPSFTVLPPSDEVEEIKCANRFEKYLIRAGLAVISRPAIKSVVMERQMEAAESQATPSASETAAVGATIKESYWAYSEMQVDYLVHTDRRVGQVKIEKRETREILTIFDIHAWEDIEEKRLREALEASGIRVRPL